MKTKKIPEDIKTKSIKDAQNEIKNILADLENSETDLQGSLDQYNRMIHLNYHIQELFKKKLKEISLSNFDTNKKSLNKN